MVTIYNSIKPIKGPRDGSNGEKKQYYHKVSLHDSEPPPHTHTHPNPQKKALGNFDVQVKLL